MLEAYLLADGLLRKKLALKDFTELPFTDILSFDFNWELLYTVHSFEVVALLKLLDGQPTGMLLAAMFCSE